MSRDEEMSADEQEYGSIRYAIQPLLLVPLRSGRIAIGSGFNPFPLLHICDPGDLEEYLLEFAAALRAEAEARRARPAPCLDPDISLNIDDILKGLTL